MFRLVVSTARIMPNMPVRFASCIVNKRLPVIDPITQKAAPHLGSYRFDQDPEHQFMKLNFPKLDAEGGLVSAKIFIIPPHKWGDREYKELMSGIESTSWKDRRPSSPQDHFGFQVSSRSDRMYLVTHKVPSGKKQRYLAKEYSDEDVWMARATAATAFIGTVVGLRDNFLKTQLIRDPHKSGQWVLLRRFVIADTFSSPQGILDYPKDYRGLLTPGLIAMSCFRGRFGGDMDDNKGNLLFGNGQSGVIKSSPIIIDTDYAMSNPNHPKHKHFADYFFGKNTSRDYAIGSIAHAQAETEKYGGSEKYLEAVAYSDARMATLAYAFHAADVSESEFLKFEVPKSFMVGVVNGAAATDQLLYSGQFFTKSELTDPNTPPLAHQQWRAVFAEKLRTGRPLTVAEMLTGHIKVGT